VRKVRGNYFSGDGGFSTRSFQELNSSSKLMGCQLFCEFVDTGSSFSVWKRMSPLTFTLLTQAGMRSIGWSRFRWRQTAGFEVMS
jgi:hypothetical protein